MEGLYTFLPWFRNAEQKQKKSEVIEESVSSGSLFPREDMHQAVAKRLRALQAGQ